MLHIAKAFKDFNLIFAAFVGSAVYTALPYPLCHEILSIHVFCLIPYSRDMFVLLTQYSIKYL